jgi:hypothetical protein
MANRSGKGHPASDRTAMSLPSPTSAGAPGTLKAVGYKAKVVRGRTEDRRPAKAIKLDADRRPRRPASRWRGRGASFDVEWSMPTASAARPMSPGRFQSHRPRHLARRIQQRQDQLHQQPLSQHRMRHQPRRHPGNAHAGQNHPHRDKRQPGVCNRGCDLVAGDHHRRPGDGRRKRQGKLTPARTHR